MRYSLFDGGIHGEHNGAGSGETSKIYEMHDVFFFGTILFDRVYL